MRRVVDTLTGDLFASIPKAHPLTPGGWRFRGEIAHVMSEAIKLCAKDRYQIAADMSRLLGREVSLNTLDKYTSEASEDHIPNWKLPSLSMRLPSKPRWPASSPESSAAACCRAKNRYSPSWAGWNR